jgi:hypothetical protein
MTTLVNYSTPDWMSWAFLAVIFIPSIMISRLVKKTIGQGSAFYAVSIFFTVYFIYVTVAAFSGWFNHVFLPPLVLLYCTFPLAIFLFTYVIRSKAYRHFMDKVKLEDLVSIHLFRLIGIFFLLLAFHHALPKFFAIIAGLGDMLTAVSSIYIAKTIREKKPSAKLWLLIWNTFGFLDIVFTAITAIVLTKLSIDTSIMGVDKLASFPYCFIPAFAPPIIIFLHVSIFKKMKNHWP